MAKTVVPQELLTPTQAAIRASVVERTVRRWVDSEKLPAYRRGHRILIDAADLDEFLTPKPWDAA